MQTHTHTEKQNTKSVPCTTPPTPEDETGCREAQELSGLQRELRGSLGNSNENTLQEKKKKKKNPTHMHTNRF